MSDLPQPNTVPATRTEVRPARRSQLQSRRKFREWAWCYFYLFPFLLFFVAFTIWPMVASVTWSFTDFRVPGGSTTFIGLQNFRELLNDDLFKRSFVNTLIFGIGNTALKLPLALLLALLLTRKWAVGKTFFRTIYFLPIVVPTAIAGLIFAFLLHPLNGAVPNLLRDAGLISSRDNIFLGSRATAMMSIILVSVWQILGQYMIYWMAALQSVPESLTDAAQIDGATFWQELLYVTLPSIKPLAIIITFLGLVNAFGVFGIVLTLTGGGPGSQSYVTQLWVYDRAFTQMPFRYGYISAGGLLFALFVLVVFALQAVAVRRAQAQIAGGQ